MDKQGGRLGSQEPQELGWIGEGKARPAFAVPCQPEGSPLRSRTQPPARWPRNMKTLPGKINLQLKKQHDGSVLSKVISIYCREKTKPSFRHNLKTWELVTRGDTGAFAASASWSGCWSHRWVHMRSSWVLVTCELLWVHRTCMKVPTKERKCNI